MVVLLSRTADASETAKRCTQGLFVWRLHVELTTVGQFAIFDAFIISRASLEFRTFSTRRWTRDVRPGHYFPLLPGGVQDVWIFLGEYFGAVCVFETLAPVMEAREKGEWCCDLLDDLTT